MQLRAARSGVDWMVWAVVCSPDIPDGLPVVRRYSWADMVEAHAVMHALGTMRDLQRERAESRAWVSRGR